jgi:L-ascorbate metabolism protein UlaG (beta-lactamase superfamily)
MMKPLLRAFSTALLGGAMLLAGAAGAAAGDGKIGLKFLGHATFEVTSPGGTTILLDPFLSKNPKTPEEYKDLGQYQPDAILVTYSHFDHVADAEAIAKASGAPIIGAYEHAGAMDVPKDQQKGGNVGGKYQVGDVTVHYVPAMHSSEPGGRPVGFVLEFGDGRTLYDTGDTWIFGDMALIEEIHSPDIVLLQAGGGPYNQDPEIARMAIDKYFDPEVVVPMHYGTFGVLANDADVEAALGDHPAVRIMQPGDSAEF